MPSRTGVTSSEPAVAKPGTRRGRADPAAEAPADAIRILGTGKCLPPRVVSASELEQRLGLREGWVAHHSGVLTRHLAEGQPSSALGAEAARAALDEAGLTLADIDCVVCTSGIPEQAIPTTASLVLARLQGEGRRAIPAFDVNATCLGFLTGLDLVSAMIGRGTYERVLLVACEVTSVGMDWGDPRTCTIFGDGAAAAVMGRAAPGETSRIVAAAMETHAEHAHLCEIRGGGSRVHPHDPRACRSDFLFQMDGPAVFRVSTQLLPGFVERLLGRAGVSLAEISAVIPHQASPSALRLMERRLGLAEGQMYVIAHRVGNVVAASIPLALHEAVAEGRVQRGDCVMLLGTSAGFSMGGVVLVY